jgi:hydrogenase-1 operon protein HyaF
MRIEDIPVADTGSIQSVGNVQAILHEIEALLARLVTSGAGGSIDLQALPLAPADYAMLEDRLGTGEVQAVIEALGPTQLRETAVPGVWWVTHRNHDGQVTAELIEVCYLPEILRTDPRDAEAGLERLRAQLRVDPGGGDVD